MPTGYTHAVQTGQVTDFPTFALDCARAFGALIEMRDEPAGTPIPEAFEPSDYHQKAAREAEAELKRLLSMAPEEIIAAAAARNAGATAKWLEQREKCAKERERYEAMLEKVKAWTPPTREHNGLRGLMVSQLEDSIRFDCSFAPPRPTPKSPDDWHRDRIAQARRDIEYHTSKDQEERERTEGRNRWVRQLRESLTTADPIRGE